MISHGLKQRKSQFGVREKKIDHNVIIFLILQLLQILFLFDCNLQTKIYLTHWKAFPQSEYIFPSVYSEVMFKQSITVKDIQWSR